MDCANLFFPPDAICATPEAEYGLSWAPDGKTLYYTSERDGNAAIYSAVMERPDDDINFENTHPLPRHLYRNTFFSRCLRYLLIFQISPLRFQFRF